MPRQQKISAFYFAVPARDKMRSGDITDAGVAELVDVPDLGSGAARHGGSSPSARTPVMTIKTSE